MGLAMKSSTYDATIDMLQLLNDSELSAIQSVAKVFIINPSVARPYQPLTEEQLLERIDTALKHINEGLYEDTELVEESLRAEFGI